MAKPDLQPAYVSTATGDLKRLKGKLGLGEAFENIIVANGPLDAAASGIPVGGIYAEATTSGLAVRLS